MCLTRAVSSWSPPGASRSASDRSRHRAPAPWRARRRAALLDSCAAIVSRLRSAGRAWLRQRRAARPASRRSSSRSGSSAASADRARSLRTRVQPRASSRSNSGQPPPVRAACASGCARPRRPAPDAGEHATCARASAGPITVEEQRRPALVSARPDSIRTSSRRPRPTDDRAPTSTCLAFARCPASCAPCRQTLNAEVRQARAELASTPALADRRRALRERVTRAGSPLAGRALCVSERIRFSARSAESACESGCAVPPRSHRGVTRCRRGPRRTRTDSGRVARARG